MASDPVEKPEVKFTQIFINNEFVNSVSGKTFATINPCNGEKIADVQEGDQADVDNAVKAARKAFDLGSEWRTMDASGRGRLLYKLADLIERDLTYLVRLEALDCGKPLGYAEFDVLHIVNVFRYFAGWCDKITGTTIPVDGNFFCYTRHEPIGVCGQIIPWNFPLVLLTWKWSAALACGCTTVLKPAEQTPLTALYMASLAREAGFPAGVINVVPGYGSTAGAAIAAHPDIDKVAFTGSTEVGRKVMAAAAASNLKRCTLELGGKSPLIIFSDADLDVAANVAHEAIMAYQGQVCCAGSRTYVQEDVYDKFIEHAKKAAEERVISDTFAPGCQHGPQIDENQFNKVLHYIDVGQKEGAKLVTGGSRHGDVGYFVKPTIFADVKDDMKIAKDEIFGPVQCVIKFKDINDAIKKANTTHYGLAAGVITNDINKALTIANSVKGGSVWINCWDPCSPQAPFGGFRQSGFGKELGEEALKEYSEVKAVVVKLSEKNS